MPSAGLTKHRILDDIYQYVTKEMTMTSLRKPAIAGAGSGKEAACPVGRQEGASVISG